MKRKVVISCLFLLTSLTTLTACLPGPFEQNVPETRWVIDDNGNKTKVTLNANNDSNAELVAFQKATEEKLVQMYSPEHKKKSLKAYEMLTNPSESNESKIESLFRDYPEVRENVYLGTMSDSSIVNTLIQLYSMSGLSEYNEASIKVPIQAVNYQTDKGSLIVNRITATVDGDEATFPHIKGKMPFISDQGQWKIDAVSLAKEFGTFEKDSLLK